MCSSDDMWEMGQGGFRNDFSCLKGELSPVLKPWGLILILLLLLLLLKLLGCHQLIKLYRFQVYNFIHIYLFPTQIQVSFRHYLSPL